MDRSFFLTQLQRRGIDLAAGPQSYVLALVANRDVMTPIENPTTDHWTMVEEGTFVSEFGALKGAMPVFQRTHSAVLRVAGKDQPAQIIGLLYEVDALRAYAKALADTAAEEHSYRYSCSTATRSWL